MGVTAGPAEWWVASPEAIDSLAISCPVATTLPDGSRIICKSGGTAWIVAPETTQVGEPWGNVTACGCIDNSPPGVSVHSDITSENFPCLYNQLISCGFNPCDWFVPCYQLLQNPGFVCRTNWDSFSSAFYWSSTEFSTTDAYFVCYSFGGACFNFYKTSTCCVRAFRCVTY
jgi:hypothetical protein